MDRRDEQLWLIQAGELQGHDPPYLPGDVNPDGTVDGRDGRIMASTWRGTWQQSASTYRDGDFDFSGFVDAADLNLFGLNFGKSIAKPKTVPVPEPCGLSLLLILLLLPRLSGHITAKGR